MTVYEREYGTDWQAVDPDEAFERAYALGVAETLGESHPGELEQLVASVDTARDRALVRLAYDKGRSRGAVASSRAETDTEVWSSLLSEDERASVQVANERDLPPPLRRLPMFDRPSDGLDRLRLPKFLLRR